ncbi:LSM domain protein, partial [Opisthorchis viverrini]
MSGGMPAQLGGIVSARPPMPTQCIGAPNPAAGVAANQMATMAHLRSPASVGRPIMPNAAMSAMPADPHVPGSVMMNHAAEQRQSAGRPRVPMQQVMTGPAGGMPRPSMASVVAGGPYVRPIAPQVPRNVMHPSMGAMLGAPVKLNGNREVIGTLRGFDAFMNIVINDAMEITKDGQQLRIDMAVIRGNSINIVEAID